MKGYAIFDKNKKIFYFADSKDIYKEFINDKNRGPKEKYQVVKVDTTDKNLPEGLKEVLSSNLLIKSHGCVCTLREESLAYHFTSIIPNMYYHVQDLLQFASKFKYTDEEMKSMAEGFDACMDITSEFNETDFLDEESMKKVNFKKLIEEIIKNGDCELKLMNLL